MIGYKHTSIALFTFCLQCGLFAQTATLLDSHDQSRKRAYAQYTLTSFVKPDYEYLLPPVVVTKKGLTGQQVVFNPLTARHQSLTQLVPLMHVKDDAKDPDIEACLDIGINVTSLISSKRLQPGYTGLGFTFNVHLLKYLGWSYQRNYWHIKAIDPENPYTPFQSLHTPMNISTLRISTHIGKLSPSFMLGVGGASKRIGGHRWGGFILGLGIHLPLYCNLGASFVLERRYFGDYGPSGDIYDIHNEISVQVTYSIKPKS